MDKDKSLARHIFEAGYGAGRGQGGTGGFNKYLFEANPAILRNIARKLANHIPAETEVLAGLEMGGIPIVTALSLECGIPAAYVRKETKAESAERMAEGAPTAGRRACVVADVVTTGRHVLASVEALRRAGAEVKHVLCVIESDPQGGAALKAEGLALHSLFAMKEITGAGPAQ